MNIALVETKPSATQFGRYFDFEFDRYALCSNSDIQKVLKKDVDIDINADDYDWLILVGAEAFKWFTKKSSVTEYNGKIIDEKFLALMNPAVIKFRPEAKKSFEEAVESITKYISGELKIEKLNEEKCYGIQDKETALKFIQEAIDAPRAYVALDSETSALYARDGYMLGFSMSYEPDHGIYCDSDVIDEEIENKLQELFNKKTIVFHNAKFDLQWFEYHFGFKFPKFEDTMLMHYMFDENPGTHGLKQLAMNHTPYGDYEKPLSDWSEQYRKTHGVLKADFSYDLIPFDIMKNYAAMDAVVTFLLYEKMRSAIEKNNKLLWVYENILLEGCNFLKQVESNGVPFDRERLNRASAIMAIDIQKAIDQLYEYPEIAKYEKFKGSSFNPNSTVQLRELMFDFIGLTPTGKKTGTGADSTDAEVLQTLAQEHDVPKFILEIRRKVKIKNTYLDKIIPNLDRDSRLRTGFNLHGTTSGRLSSSGKLNMQQLPRDNPTVKGCIKASKGHKIVAMDLTTAEVYVAAVLAKDENLKRVFRSGGNFHSTIAKQVFNLPCAVEEVDTLYKDRRQQAKAVTFGIMYGAGAQKISWQVSKDSGKEFTVNEASRVIDNYFTSFKNLKKWLEIQESYIKMNGFIYSIFGRKRRLPNAQSKNKGIASHEVRSGINFLVQSAASDINLMGAIDMQKYINENSMKARIFALVHDSILAEVPEEEIEHYNEKLKQFIQKERGCSIDGAPVGCDFEVGDDYSMGKWDTYYNT